MNKRLRLLLILAALFITGCMTHPPNGEVNTNTKPGEITLNYKILDVPLFAQATRVWCWAASGEMIMHYYGEKVPQHVQANKRFKRGDCGPKTRASGCIKTAWPEFRRFGFHLNKPKYGALPWQELVKQIHANQPVGFSWKWEKCERSKSYGSHYMVVRGYIILNDMKLVVVNDPLPANPDKTKGGTISIMTYDDYVQFCPRYTHSYTHYDITKPGGKLLKQKFLQGPGTVFSKRVPGRRRQGAFTAALESLELLKALPWPLLKELGFKSKRVVEKISLGKKPLYSLGIGKKPGNAVEAHYPVKVDKELVNAVTIRKRGGKWAFAVIGDRGALSAVKAMKETPAPRGTAFFMVQIQSMNLTFLAFFSEDEDEDEDIILYLIPTHEDPDLTFPLYKPVPAEEVFLELKYSLEQLAEEKGGATLKNKLTGYWKEMDKAIQDLESGEKTGALRGMKRAVEIINQVFGELESQEGGENDKG